VSSPRPASLAAAGRWITDHLGWRWVFYVNLPLGALTFVVFVLVMPSIRPQSVHRSLDRLGIGLLVMAVVPLVLAFSWGGSQYDWLSPQVIGLLVLASVATVAFLRVERDAVEPIIPYRCSGARSSPSSSLLRFSRPSACSAAYPTSRCSYSRSSAPLPPTPVW